MAERYFEDWESLIAEANRAVKRVLKNDVAPVAEDILRYHIMRDIYDAYTPKEGKWVGGTTYIRRHVLEDSITSFFEDDETLVTTSTATSSPSIVKGHRFRPWQVGGFLELIESGNTGIWRSGFPRPAVGNAQAEIDRSPVIQKAITQGLKREFSGVYKI